MIRSIIMARQGMGLLTVGALVVLLGADEGDCTGSPQINNTVIVCVSADGSGKCENEVIGGSAQNPVGDDGTSAGEVDRTESFTALEDVIRTSLANAAGGSAPVLLQIESLDEPAPHHALAGLGAATSTDIDIALQDMSARTQTRVGALGALLTGSGATITWSASHLPFVVVDFSTGMPSTETVRLLDGMVVSAIPDHPTQVLQWRVGAGSCTGTPPAEPIDMATLRSRYGLTRVDNYRSSAANRPVKVGIIDNGIDFLHPIIQNKVFVARDCFNGDSACRPIVASVAPPYEPRRCAGHGTSVASIIAGQDADPASPNTDGLGGNVRLYAYAIDDNTSTTSCLDCGSTSPSTVIKAMQQAMLDRVDVLNISLGFKISEYGALRAAESRATFENVANTLMYFGIATFVSIGNEISKCGGQTYEDMYSELRTPATAPNVMSVGAYFRPPVQSTGTRSTSCYSVAGADRLRVEPDILLPSAEGFRTSSTQGYKYGILAADDVVSSDRATPTGVYSFGGTSAAAAVASGVASAMLPHLWQSFAATSNGGRYVEMLYAWLVAEAHAPDDTIAQSWRTAGSAGYIGPLRTRSPRAVGSRCVSRGNTTSIDVSLPGSNSTYDIGLWWAEKNSSDRRNLDLSVKYVEGSAQGAFVCTSESKDNKEKCAVNTGSRPGRYRLSISYPTFVANSPLPQSADSTACFGYAVVQRDQ